MSDDRPRPPRSDDERGRPKGPNPASKDRDDLAGPSSWGRVARKGAGSMDAPDPDTVAREKRKAEREAEKAERRAIWEAKHRAELIEAGIDPDAEPEPEPEMPERPNVVKPSTAAPQAAKPKGPSSPPARERDLLGSQAQLNNDPAATLAKLVGPERGKRLAKRLDQGAEAFAAERFADARQALAAVVKEAPELPEGRELMGLALYRLGKWEQAIENLEAFRSLSHTTEQHPVLADCHRALGRWDDVDYLWRELGEVSPSAELVTEGRIVYAGSLADRGDLQGALRTLEKGFKQSKSPRTDQLRRAYALADLYDRAGKAPRARELFKWVARHDPELADVADRVRALS